MYYRTCTFKILLQQFVSRGDTWPVYREAFEALDSSYAQLSVRRAHLLQRLACVTFRVLVAGRVDGASGSTAVAVVVRGGSHAAADVAQRARGGGDRARLERQGPQRQRHRAPPPGAMSIRVLCTSE